MYNENHWISDSGVFNLIEESLKQKNFFLNHADIK